MNVWDNRSLFRLLWPLVVEQILAVTMGAMDTFMVSSAGEAALSGVNIIDNINNLFIIAFTALCTGGTVVVSHYIGRSNAAGAQAASRQLYYVVVLAALLVMVPAMIWRRPVIRFLYGAVAKDVMEAAAVYFLITAASYPFLGVYNACAALFRAAGNSAVPMRIALLVNITNIAGNSLFIYALGLGAMGAAIATLISRIIAAAVLTGMLIRGGTPYINLGGLRRVSLNREMAKRILNVGIPSGLEGSMFQMGRLLTQRIFTSFGTAAIAGNAIASVINSFSYMPGMAYCMALLTVAGQCVGAGDYEGARRNTIKIMKISWITLLFLSLVIFVFMDPVIGFFHLSPEAFRLAKSFLRVHCVSMAVGWTFSFALPNALRAAGDARYVMIAAAVSMFAVRVSFSYLITFTLGAGPLGVWIAMGLDFLSRGGCYLHRWLGGKWREKRVI
ncbi:MAG: MATE family efflux transporter [Treponema sp.]|nr:MATE family efflux transporter [Treponema sp.]